MRPVTFITDGDIEARMEKELTLSGLWPEEESAVFDVEAFLTVHLKVDLDKDAPLPADRLGEVIFRSNRRTHVKINVDLTAQAESEALLWQVGRWRWTVAHESAHVVLHGPLYITEGQGGLFDDDAHVHECFKQDIGSLASVNTEDFAQTFGWDSGRLLNESPAKRRMEIQANKAAGALLMPRSIFIPFAHTVFDKAATTLPTDHARTAWAVARLANRFNVSLAAARIRCHELRLLQRSTQIKIA